MPQQRVGSVGNSPSRSTRVWRALRPVLPWMAIGFGVYFTALLIERGNESDRAGKVDLGPSTYGDREREQVVKEANRAHVARRQEFGEATGRLHLTFPASGPELRYIPGVGDESLMAAAAHFRMYGCETAAGYFSDHAQRMLEVGLTTMKFLGAHCEITDSTGGSSR